MLGRQITHRNLYGETERINERERERERVRVDKTYGAYMSINDISCPCTKGWNDSMVNSTAWTPSSCNSSIVSRCASCTTSLCSRFRPENIRRCPSSSNCHLSIFFVTFCRLVPRVSHTSTLTKSQCRSINVMLKLRRICG